MALVSVGAGAVGNRTYRVGGDTDFLPTLWGCVICTLISLLFVHYIL